MSGGSDNIFDRWSRRKQAVRDSEKAPPDAEEHAPEAVAPEADARPAEPDDRPLTAAEPDAGEPAEPLPTLEDLTAQSDLSAFLREGVPKALRSAAMRKMWSLDPAIRDYIGPSEYAWDFNQPGSMAGFGPLDDAGESVAEFLSTMSGGVRAGLARVAKAPEASSTSQQAADVPTEQGASDSPDGPADLASPDESLELPPVPASPQSRSPGSVAAASEPTEAVKSTASPRIPTPPRHGRAMPR